MKLFASVTLIYLLHTAPVGTTSDWEIFARVKFNAKLDKEFNEYFLVPFFDSKIKAYEGKEITLRGHFMSKEKLQYFFSHTWKNEIGQE